MADIMTNTKKSWHWQTLLLALGIGTIIFLPFVIFDGGYFTYYGDFNVQQIPFYKLAHEAVRSGNIFWNWHTDLGVNFIGSYSFYLLFSPFFWLTLPFPTSFVPYLMAPLLVLKTGCAAFTAYFYLARFVKDRRYAVIGGLFYAFSGWMAFNIFFNHFHEVAVFFPLLLIGMEKLVWEKQKGFLALAVALNAMVNYWFFIGEAVFVVIYFLIRLTDKNFRQRVSAARFFQIVIEAVIGVGCAAVVLLPSALAIIGNPRTGTGELLNGWGVWLYWHEQRLPAILQSILFPPELPARPNSFPDHGAKWSSLSAWLPMFGVSGVVAYFFQRRGDWLKKILALSLLFALVPGFNSLFVLLNNSYYARWFYMPVLLMALASVRAVEDCAYDLGSFRRSFKWCGIIMAGFVLAVAFTPTVSDEGEIAFGLMDNPVTFWMFATVALAGLALTAVLILCLRQHRRFPVILGAGVAMVAIMFTITYMTNGRNSYERSQFVIHSAIEGREQISLPDDQFARADAFETQDNLLMFWGLPNIQTFHSIVPPSIMEFYPTMGVTRDVGSRPEAKFYALRSLLSVRWLFIESVKEEQSPMPGWTKYAEQVGFNIYENDNFIPMGFAYDAYIDREELEEFPVEQRGNVLLKAVVLEDMDAIRRYKDILVPLNMESFTASEEALAEDSAARAQYTAENFRIDNYGFSAETHFDDEKLLFFSVPWEAGWTAYIDGQTVPIEKVNVGFMAVRVPAGDCAIRFEYMTPGLLHGAMITAGAALLLLIYLLVGPRKKAGEPEATPALQSILPENKATHLTEQEYRAAYPPARERADNLQRALNEAAAKKIDDSLPQEEQTLKFVTPGEEENGD